MKCAFLLILLFLVPMNFFGDTNLSNAPYHAGKPDVVVTKDGYIVVVWQESDDWELKFGHGIFYNVWDPDTGDWRGRKDAHLNNQKCATPHLAQSPDGKVHCTWADGNNSANREIKYASYDPVTDNWSSPVFVWVSPDNSAWQRIRVVGDYIYIVWEHKHGENFGGFDIVMSYKKWNDPSSDWIDPYENITEHPRQGDHHPDFHVIPGSPDRVVVVNMHDDIPLQGPHKVQAKFGQRGANWHGIPAEILFVSAYYPAMTVDENGKVYLLVSNKKGTILTRMFDGNSWHGQQQLSTAHAALQFAEIFCRGESVIAIWTQKYSATGTQSVFYSERKNTGWTAATLLAAGVGPDREDKHPRLFIDSGYMAHFVYENRGGGGVNDIFYTTLQLTPPNPILSLSVSYLDFTLEGENPAPETFTITNVGGQNLNYNITKDKNWLSVSPTSGSLGMQESNDITVEIDGLDLDEGIHEAKITVKSGQAVNSPQEIDVTLNVLAPPIYAPLNFAGEALMNKSLFYREYFHSFSWEANPDNRDIDHYRLYEIDEMENKIFLAEFGADTLTYIRRNIDPTKTYIYRLSAVDYKDREGKELAQVTINAPQ
jgi:hypothetical protein